MSVHSDGIIARGIMAAARQEAEHGKAYRLGIYPGGARHPDPTRISLSSVGSCQRALGYRVIGVPRPPHSDKTIMTFRMGHLLEAEVVHLLKRAVRLKLFGDHKVRLSGVGNRQGKVAINVNGRILSGHPDGKIVVDGVPYVLEIKSTKEYTIAKALKEGRESLSRSWLDQANAYMLGSRCRRHKFILISKDTRSHPPVVELDGEMDEAAIRNVANRLHLAYGATEGNLPEREYKKSSWQCKFCDYRGKCWDLGEDKG